MGSEFLHFSSMSIRKYRGRGKNHVLLFRLSIVKYTHWSWPLALFTEGLYTNLFIKYTVSDYTDRQNLLSPSKSRVWAMTTPLSDNSFQDTHIHIAYWKFLITRKGCSSCIIVRQLQWVFPCSVSFLYLVLLFSSLTQAWVPSWSINLNFRSFLRLNIIVILTGSRLTGGTRWNLLNPETTAERTRWNSMCPGFYTPKLTSNHHYINFYSQYLEISS